MMLSDGAIVVTGAVGDIGSAIALATAAAGHPVCVNFRSDAAPADELVRRIEAIGGKAMAHRADVADPAQVKGLFAAAEHGLGSIRGLVNNAGIIGGKSRVEDLDATTLRKVLETNVIGAFLCAAEAVRRMSARHGRTGGAIVNISSRAAGLGGANEWVHYAASKGAIDSFTVGLAREVAGEGIRVNAVSPGLIDTRIHAQSGDPGRLDRLAGSVPMGRPGTALEVADAVVFLLSARAAYVTGTRIDVSGGR